MHIHRNAYSTHCITTETLQEIMGGVRGEGKGVATPVPPSAAHPRKNFDGDNVPSSNHTHAKV